MKKIIILIFLSVSLFANNITKYDQILKTSTTTIYYNYDLKGAVKDVYDINGSLVNKLNIKKRPSFKANKNIPKKYRSYSGDYKHSGYDRGHLAPDAAFDYNKTALRSIYYMDNITPQLPNFNRKIWKYIEIYDRFQAVKYKNIKITILVFYKKPIKKIGKHNIAVPYKFMKWVQYPKMSKKQDDCYEVFNNNKFLKSSNKTDYLVPVYECQTANNKIQTRAQYRNFINYIKKIGF